MVGVRIGDADIGIQEVVNRSAGGWIKCTARGGNAHFGFAGLPAAARQRRPRNATTVVGFCIATGAEELLAAGNIINPSKLRRIPSYRAKDASPESRFTPI